MNEDVVLPAEQVENIILLVRGQKVILDRDLAKAVKRNIDRFPNDFMFQLTTEEYKSLRFRFGIFKKGQHSKYLAYAFTEQGVAMLSSVLKSKRSIEVNIAIMTSFVQPRFLGRDLTNYLWSSALICVHSPAPRCPACPVGPGDGTGVGPEDRTGVAN